MSSSLKRDSRDFLKGSILLLIAGIFLCAGVFLVLTYLFGDVEYTVDDEYWPEGSFRSLQYNRPILIGQANLQDTDVIYIEFRASDDIDIMVDSFNNCTRYVNEHNSFEPYDLPPQAYKFSGEEEGKIEVVVHNKNVGIIFQKTPYSGYDKVDLNYRITYPDHFGSRSCIIIGLMFIVSGISVGIIHFYLGKKRRRFDPMDDGENDIKREIRDSKPMPTDEPVDEYPGKKKHEGKKKGAGKKGKRRNR